MAEELKGISLQVATLAGSVDSDEVRTSFRRTGDALDSLRINLSQVSALVAEVRARSEQIVEMRSEQAKLREKQEAEFRALDNKIEDLSTRLAQLEVISRILQLSSGRQLEGATITTPSGKTVYKDNEIQKFIDDAAKETRKGRRFKVAVAEWDDTTFSCVGEGDVVLI